MRCDCVQQYGIWEALRVGLTCLQRLTLVPALGLIVFRCSLLGDGAANSVAAPEVGQEYVLEVYQ